MWKSASASGSPASRIRRELTRHRVVDRDGLARRLRSPGDGDGRRRPPVQRRRDLRFWIHRRRPAVSLRPGCRPRARADAPRRSAWRAGRRPSRITTCERFLQRFATAFLATLAHEVEHATERDEQAEERPPVLAEQRQQTAALGLRRRLCGRLLGGLAATCGSGSGSVAAAGASAGGVALVPGSVSGAVASGGGVGSAGCGRGRGCCRSAPAASPALRCGPRACASLPRARSRAVALWSAGRRSRPTTGASSKPLRCPAPVSPAAGARSRSRRPRCLPARPGTVSKPPRLPPTR